MTAPPEDRVRRTAIISAFAPELAVLERDVRDAETVRGANIRFVTGMIADQPVVLLLSGMSMVNAAMAAQAVLDRFTVSRILFSGIAGGVDPLLDVGDVVVPERWCQYLEAVFARETPAGFVPPPPPFDAAGDAHHGMIFRRAVELCPPGGDTPERRLWFAADAGLLALARQVAATVPLARRSGALCLRTAPRVVVGGHGVSGSAFVDNAGFRDWVHATFQARVLDMESAAVAHVAYANAVPFIAFRSLSDLAGGDPVENQAATFFRIAADNAAAMVRAFVAALPPPEPGLAP